ncbi:MAG: anti-sigma factor family protein [Elusimicrobiota bacterium]
MKCKKIKKEIWKVFDRETPVSEREMVLEHIDKCDGCRKLYKEVESLTKDLRDFPAYNAPPEFTNRLKNRITQTYGYPEKEGEQEKGVKMVLKYGIPTALAAAVVFLIFFAGPVEDKGAVQYYSPGQKISLTGYDRSSGLLSKRAGYMRVKLKSEARLEKVTVEINLPREVKLADNGKKAVWSGNLEKGTNVLLLKVKGEKEGKWDINGVIKKNGLRKQFTKKVSIM